ncbi:RNA polymerase sigma factor, region 3/4 [Acididesulfobacillus acetoxydans]|uniref:Major sigma-70 factor signature n=1 Tax=Acididesulfobacillus acetoxydans TaxID=1561005 RepID=A0A8S0XXV1_9FIRM|nr:RNA polymerase sigma factor, region 3/4 [Acididesulfobacillus acetoxydans]CEJ08209.1 Major sigma-70 factor signature [Acididesulfobacillus acetoxydans]
MYTREQIVAAVENCLSEREQQIIKTRFGLDSGVTVTLAEIELIYGLTREQVRLLEKQLLTYVRTSN